MPKSEYGRGFIYNLLLFNAHFYNAKTERIEIYNFVMQMPPEEKEKVLRDNPDMQHNYKWNKEVKFWFDRIVPLCSNDEKRALADEIRAWANGAVDHLEELQIPEQWKNHEIGELTQKMLKKAYVLTLYDEVTKPTFKDFKELKNLTHKIALAIDNALGVETCQAEWT